MRLSGRGRLAERLRHVPAKVAACVRLEYVQVVQVFGHVVFGVFGLVFEPAEQIDFVVDLGEAVAESRARQRVAVFDRWVEFFPLPVGYGELV